MKDKLVHSLKLTARPWKWMVEDVISSWVSAYFFRCYLSFREGTNKMTFEGNVPSYLAFLKTLLTSNESGWIHAIKLASLLFRGVPFSYDFLCGFSGLVKYYHSCVWVKVGCGMNSRLAVGGMEIDTERWCHLVLVHRTGSTYLSSIFEGGMYLQLSTYSTSKYPVKIYQVQFSCIGSCKTTYISKQKSIAKQPSHCFCSRQSDIFHGGSDGTTIRVAEPKSLFTWFS